MKLRKNFRDSINVLMIALVSAWQIGLPAYAADYYWDTDGNDAGNTALSGAGLGESETGIFQQAVIGGMAQTR